MFWILAGIAIAAFVYYKVVKPHTYWRNKGVKQGSIKIPFGDSTKPTLRQQSFAEMVGEVYGRFPDSRYSGIYQMNKPTFLIRDPELIKQIGVKDFDNFTDHMNFIPDDQEQIWNKNLFALKGDKWRHMRTTLSPAFTSSKMKAMFQLMSDCSEQFATYFHKQNTATQIDVELKDVFTRFTNDVIATCAFGITCDSLKNRENEFYAMGKEATDFSGIWRNVQMLIFMFAPSVCKVFGLTFFPKHVSKFFKDLVTSTVKVREEQNIVRPDMIHLLMEARKGRLSYEESTTGATETGFATVEESSIGKSLKPKQEEISDMDMTANALIFFFAGFDSVSTLMCFMGHELAINPDIQDKLREEIDEVLGSNGKLTYEAINGMKYLDMVTSETLRKWPAAVAVDRVCLNDYTIRSVRSDERDVQLVKGDIVWFPIWGLHHDPELFPDPEKFDPERFNDQNRGSIKPYTYIPFGVGPRNCIGSRFALLETKTVMCHLLHKFEIVPIAKTQIPLRLNKKGFNMTSEKGFWVGFKPRK